MLRPSKDFSKHTFRIALVDLLVYKFPSSFDFIKNHWPVAPPAGTTAPQAAKV